MLKKIRSVYLLKELFSSIDEGTKLKIIKYNKSFQKNLNINIINYKIFSGRYIIYDEDGKKWLEYNSYNDILIYKGEYLNDKRNGNGKEYDNGFLRYEGEFKNGKRNGYGHEYNSLHIIVYEGEYLNGKRNGKGKEFDPHNGKIIFFGEYLNGKRNGKGY